MRKHTSTDTLQLGKQKRWICDDSENYENTKPTQILPPRIAYFIRWHVQVETTMQPSRALMHNPLILNMPSLAPADTVASALPSADLVATVQARAFVSKVPKAIWAATEQTKAWGRQSQRLCACEGAEAGAEAAWALDSPAHPWILAARECAAEEDWLATLPMGTLRKGLHLPLPRCTARKKPTNQVFNFWDELRSWTLL